MVAKGVTALCLLLKITRARRLRLRPSRRHQGSVPHTSATLVRRFASDGHEIALDMAISQFAARAHRAAVVRITRRSPHICAYLRLWGKSECGALLCCDCAAERKHIVRHLCRAMGCLSKSRRFFPSVREKSVSMNNLSPRAEKSTSRNRHRERGAMLRASCGTGKEGAFRSSEVGAMPAAVRRYRTNEGNFSRSKVEPRCPRLYAVFGVKARFFICGRGQSAGAHPKRGRAHKITG